MVVFESIPFGLGLKIRKGSCINKHLVFIDFSLESTTIFITHFLSQWIKQILPSVFNWINKLLVMRWISDALEELNPFFSLKVFESPVLLNELLFVCWEFYIFQIQENRWSIWWSYSHWLSTKFLLPHFTSNWPQVRCWGSSCWLMQRLTWYFSELYSPCVSFLGLK